MEIYNGTYCVYVHINKINGKMYVGQTIYGDDPNKRWLNGYGYKSCTLFWRAIQKHGWDNFDHEIVASNLTMEESCHFEELLIKQLKTTNPKNGYNLKSGGENNCLSEETKRKIGNGNKGKIRTEEHKAIISRAHKGKLHTEETKRKISNGNIKRSAEHIENWCVAQYDKNGIFICAYDNVSDASYNTGISKTSINNCLAEYAKSAGSYMWIRVDKNNIMHNILPYAKINTLNNIHNKNNINMRKTPVNQFDKQYNLIKIWSSITEAANSLKIGKNNIWKCCNNIDGRKTAGSYIWSYNNKQ